MSCISTVRIDRVKRGKPVCPYAESETSTISNECCKY